MENGLDRHSDWSRGWDVRRTLQIHILRPRFVRGADDRWESSESQPESADQYGLWVSWISPEERDHRWLHRSGSVPAVELSNRKHCGECQCNPELSSCKGFRAATPCLPCCPRRF